MSMTAEWDNTEKTIILMTISGRWTWDELRACVMQCNAMIESVAHHVHFICDMGAGTWIPGGMLANMRSILQLFTPNDGYRVIVVDNPLIKDMLYVFSAFNGGLGFRYRYAKTVDEARKFLNGLPLRKRDQDDE